MFMIHYHHYSGNYENTDLWVWDARGSSEELAGAVKPSDRTEFGCVFQIPLAPIDEHVNRIEIGFVPRPDGTWERRDGDDRTWQPSEAGQIWLVHGDPRIYTSRPDVSPRVEVAWIDTPRKMVVRLSHPAEKSRLGEGSFRVRSAAGPLYKCISAHPLDDENGMTRLVEVGFDEDLRLDAQLMVLFGNYQPGNAELRDILLDGEAYYSDLELGAVCTPEETVVRVFAPGAARMDVVLYDQPTGSIGREAHAMAPVGNGVWEVRLEGDHHLRPYMISVNGTEVVDIHSRCNSDHDGRGRIVDLRRTDPPGFRGHKRPPFSGRPTDAVIWEVHVRDFTIHSSSGVPDGKRGKYLGAAQRGTKLNGSDLPTCLDHLVELGVTHVQFLPLQDFDNKEHEEYYDWGYMPVNFSSPEGWYASNPRNESRIVELKEMVAAFHDAGIRVILDVVYNHTAAQAAFERIVPGYYHRRQRDGNLWNGSGCGNEFRSEAPMARRFIVDSCRYWAEEFHFDGFRFDLMGLVDFETMCAVRDELHKVDPTLLVYGEPWAATGPDGTGIDRITDKWTVSGSGVGAFNDHYRNALKGPPDGDEPGFVQAGHHRDAVMVGLAGSIHDWAMEPGDAIQYATCHDNLTLWDKIAVCCPQAEAEEKIRMQMLTIGLLAVSQGTMFLHGGMEMGRSKFGHHNSYNAPDRVNRVDWRRKSLFQGLNDYTRKMIRLRRNHPVFRLPTRAEVDKRLRFHDDLCPGGPCIAFTLDGTGLEGESWKTTLVLVNAAPWDRIFKLPEGKWSVYTYAREAGETRLGTMSESVAVHARSMSVLARNDGS